MSKKFLTQEEFIQKYCYNCGTQRCEGIGTEWFDGCKFKDCLIAQDGSCKNGI